MEQEVYNTLLSAFVFRQQALELRNVLDVSRLDVSRKVHFQLLHDLHYVVCTYKEEFLRKWVSLALFFQNQPFKSLSQPSHL